MVRTGHISLKKITRQERVVARDGTSLYYEVIGDGHPAVLLDGLACSGFIWRRFIPYFYERLTMIHPHYRGHGKSSTPRTPHTRIMHLVEDVVTVIEKEGIERAVFLGHSLGVEVALELAHLRADMCEGLVLICGGYGKALQHFQETDLAVYLLPFFKFLEKNYPDKIQFIWKNFPISLGYKIAVRFRQVNPVLVRKGDLYFYLRHLKKVQLSVFLSLLDEMQNHDTTRFLEEISCPTLVIAGEKDTFTPPELATVIASSVPGARLFVVRGGTHIAPLELPDLVNLAIEKFMYECSWIKL